MFEFQDRDTYGSTDVPIDNPIIFDENTPRNVRQVIEAQLLIEARDADDQRYVERLESEGESPLPLREPTDADKIINSLSAQIWDNDCVVVLYEVHQAYGGPEEGGWYYPGFERVRTQDIDSDNWPDRLREADEVAQRWQEEKDREWVDDERAGVYEQDRRRYTVEIEFPRQGAPRSLRDRQPRPHYC